MVINSYSKINLSLKVISKLKNGLHEIQSMYCLVNLYDKIQIKKVKKNKDKIIFKGRFSKFIKKKNNSIYNLLKILRKLNLISNYYSISVIKNIPVFSGLGGGTSNAAFLLKFLIKKKIDNDLLNKLEPVIGTDLRLFFSKQGFLKKLKVITHLEKRQNLFFLLIQPKIRCSTKMIYSKIKLFSKKDRFNNGITRSKNKFLKYLLNNKNDLQFIVEKKYPVLKKILEDIKNENGCILSRMTGSGSVCFGLFEDYESSNKALKKLKIKYPKFWFSLAKTI